METRTTAVFQVFFFYVFSPAGWVGLRRSSNWFTNKRKRHWTPVIKKRTRSPRDFFEVSLPCNIVNTGINSRVGTYDII